MQRFPSLLFSEFGKDGYLVILLYAIVNIIGIFFAFFILKYLNREKFNSEKANIFFRFLKKRFGLVSTDIEFDDIVVADLQIDIIKNFI